MTFLAKLKSVSLGFIVVLAAAHSFAQTITTASDSAANYSGGWNSGSNGGTGFQAWNIWSSGGTGGFGGNFVGNPADGGIAGMATNSFSLYANPTGSGASANAERTLITSLAIGQTLSVQWGVNYDSGSGGNKGFNLYSGGAEIFNINNAGSSVITCNGTDVNFGYGTAAMTWSFTRVNATTIGISANDRDGTGAFETNVVVSNGAIDKLRFYASGMQSGNQAQPYFNNLKVTEPVATSLAVPGDHAFRGPWFPDGRLGTGMTRSNDPATPNSWSLRFNVYDAKTISFKFVANGSFDFSWGTDPGQPGFAKRGGDPIQFTIPATGAYDFKFDQFTRQYSVSRVVFPSYQEFADFYFLQGGQSGDPDNDGLTNGQEFVQNTDPTNPDSDGDTLSDLSEVNTSSTNPLSADSDSDTLPDWWEVAQSLNPNSSVGVEGSFGDPDADGFTNKQEFEGQSNPKLASSVPANRAITFSLDLNRQITEGSFVTNGSAVEVWGTFNDWGNFTNKFNLTHNGAGTYSGTFVVPGAAGATNRFKFVTFNSNNTLTWEPGGDRVLVMGASGVATNLPLAYLGEVRPVTFSVNMAVQKQLGNFTVGGTNKVFVVGTDIPGGWDPGTVLTQVGNSSVYSGTIWISGQKGSLSNFKFKAGNTLSYEDSTLLGTDTRVLTLGERDLPQTNEEAYFSNANGLRTVTFAVNMAVQTNTNKLSFNPATDTVEVRGTFNSFGGGTNWRLTNNGTGVFTGSFSVPGTDGATNGFKYVALVGTNVAFERVDLSRTNSLLNRTLVLGSSGTPQTAHSEASPALFSLDDGVGPAITLNGPATVNLNAGDNYTDQGATATDAIEGACSVAVGVSPTAAISTITLNPGTYTVTYSASDAAGNVGAPVTRTVVVTGSTFAGWSGGSTLDTETLAKYAIGGASSLTTLGEAPKVGTGFLVPHHYSYIEAVVRTDDSKLTVVGEASTDLTAGFDTSGTWTVEGAAQGVSQSNVPSGCERKKFIYWHGMVQERMFLRLRATLVP